MALHLVSLHASAQTLVEEYGYFGCQACAGIVNLIPVYELVEETIEDWCQIGTELLEDGEGGYGEIAIWGVRQWTQYLERISYRIEVLSDQHTCPLREEFRPEYVPPQPTTGTVATEPVHITTLDSKLFGLSCWEGISSS